MAGGVAADLATTGLLMLSEKSFGVRQVRFDELSAGLIESWASLADRALESNAYLSPHFVIPAIRHLGTPEEARRTIFVFVEKTTGETARLVGAGVFVRVPGNRNLPLPHLRAFRSVHSYLSGILVDRDEAEGAVRAFFRFFCDKRAAGHGVEFEYRPVDGPQAELITRVAAEFGSLWKEQERIQRAVFTPSEGGDAYIASRLSSSRIKEIRRMKRRLEDQGEIRWRALFGNQVNEQSVEHFLEIEHMGWKGENGTSLRSRPNHEAFFREMVDGFRKQEGLFFTEMYLDDALIASTSNLISGGAGFAFKIGWDPRYAKMSLGVLNELEFIQRGPEFASFLSYVDSGAMEGSFIDRYWGGRRLLAAGVLATSPLGRQALWSVSQLRRAKRWGMSHLKRGEK